MNTRCGTVAILLLLLLIGNAHLHDRINVAVDRAPELGCHHNGGVVVEGGMTAELKVVFDVELEFVVFQAGEVVDELEEGGEFGDFAAGGVEVG